VRAKLPLQLPSMKENPAHQTSPRGERSEVTAETRFPPDAPICGRRAFCGVDHRNQPAAKINRAFGRRTRSPRRNFGGLCRRGSKIGTLTATALDSAPKRRPC